MILPAGLDRIPELLGKIISRASGWQPRCKVVELAWTEAGDQRLVDAVSVGVIKQATEHLVVVSRSSKKGGSPALLVELCQSIEFDGKLLSRVVAMPRFPGHGPERLLVTWCAVNVFLAPSLEGELDWNSMVGICLMRLRPS